MKKQLIIAVHVALVVVCSAITANACDICGAFIGVTPYDNQSGFSLYHRYGLYSRISAIADQPLIPSGSYRMQPDYSALHTHDTAASMQKGDFESTKTIELRGKWFIHNRIELNAQLPFLMNRSRMNGELECISGMGDAAVWVGVHIFRNVDANIRQRLVLGLGVKFPTGSSGKSDADGTRYHLYMQPGTGSVDETAYLQYSMSVRKFGSALNFTVKHNGENSYEEQIEPSYTSTMNFFYMLKKENTIVLPQVQFYAERTTGYSSKGIHQSDSEMGMVMGGLGCDAYFKSLGVHVTAQIPLAQVADSNSPAATFRGVVGISWNINQQNYLLKK